MKRLTTRILMFLGIMFLTNLLYSQNTPLSIEDLLNVYTHNYTIKDNKNSKVFDYSTHHKNVYAANSHNGSNQKWVIMPTYPGSEEFMIFLKSNGYSMDRKSDNNIYCHPFHGGNNQIWRIGEVESTGNYAVYSYGTNKVFDRSSSDNIYANEYHGQINQQISFLEKDLLGNNLSTQILKYENGTGAAMPPQLNSLNEQYVHGKREGETLLAVTLIPCAFVNDPAYPSMVMKLNYSPFYRLERRQYWKLVSFKQYQEGDTEVYKSSETIGLKTENSSEIKLFLNVSYNYQQTLTVGENEHNGEKVAHNFKINAGVEYIKKNTTTINSTDSKEYTLTRTYDSDQLFFFYQLVDEFKLYRMNSSGDNHILSWDYAAPINLYTTQYPNVSPATLKNATLENNFEPDNQIPIMNANYMFVGNQLHRVHASSTFSSSYQAWRAVDGNDVSGTSSRWISKNYGNFTPQWLEFNFGTNKKVQSYCIKPEGWSLINRSPKSWKLQGYDGRDWVTIDSRTNYTISYWQENLERNFTIPSTANYSRYRLLIEETNGSPVTSIIRFKLYSTTDAESRKKSSTDNLTTFSKLDKTVFAPEDKFTVSPNPSNGSFKIKFGNSRFDPMINLPDTPRVERTSPIDFLKYKNIELGVYSLSGKLIRRIIQSRPEEEHNIKLNPGIYLLKCDINGKVMSEKLIIK